MIYLIRSAAFIDRNNKTCENFEVILKIGYTGEESRRKRFGMYVTENPTYQILKQIPGGTLEDEASLHKFFKDLKKPYGQEWFENSEKILKFFEDNDTIEKIRAVVPSARYGRKYKTSTITSALWPIVRAIYEITGNFDHSIYEECAPFEEDAYKWVQKKYPAEHKSIIEFYSKRKSLITNRIQTLIDDESSNKKTKFRIRFKNFCDNKDYTNEEKEIASEFISESYFLYYNILEPDKCRALGYNITFLKNAISDLSITVDDILSELLVRFKPGFKYSNVEIKQAIKEIYQKLGYNKSPKASDLKEYFDLRAVKFVNQDKKSVNGYEILGLKK